MSLAGWISIGSLAFSFLVSNTTLFFKAGHLSARVEALESWRPGIRQDMHEISEKMELFGTQIQELKTLILERTERRQSVRN